MNKKLILSLAAILISQSALSAQPVKKNSEMIHSALELCNYDLAAEGIQSGHAYNEVKKLYKILSDLNIPIHKSEYETVAEFKNRQERSAGAWVSSACAVRLPSDFSYNAEKEEFSLSIDLNFMDIDTSHNSSDFVIQGYQTTTTSKRYYTGANVYNSKTHVLETRDVGFALGLRVSDRMFSKEIFQKIFYRDKVYATLSIKFNAPRSQAMELNRQLVAIVVGQPVLPLTFEHKEYHDPTIDNPTDSITTYKGPIIAPQALIVYEKKNGTILLKIDARN